jgi:hypothetical protein
LLTEGRIIRNLKSDAPLPSPILLPAKIYFCQCGATFETVHDHQLDWPGAAAPPPPPPTFNPSPKTRPHCHHLPRPHLPRKAAAGPRQPRKGPGGPSGPQQQTTPRSTRGPRLCPLPAARPGPPPCLHGMLESLLRRRCVCVKRKGRTAAAYLPFHGPAELPHSGNPPVRHLPVLT